MPVIIKAQVFDNADLKHYKNENKLNQIYW